MTSWHSLINRTTMPSRLRGSRLRSLSMMRSQSRNR